MAIATTGEQITADTIPDLDDWGFDSFWDCIDWIEWHKIMKSVKGKQVADATFLQYWNMQSTGAHGIDCRSLNNGFRDYFRSQNLLDSLYSGIGVIAQPIGTAGDVAGAAGDVISNVASTASNTSKVLTWLIPTIIVIVVIIVLIWVWVKFIGKPGKAK